MKDISKEELQQFLSSTLMEGWGVSFQVFDAIPDDLSVLDLGIRQAV